MTRALETRIRRLEVASPEVVAGIVVLTAGSPEGERALVAEGERRGEISPRDLVVTIKRFAWEGADNCPIRTRNVAGQVRPILDGFAEPSGTPWLPDVDQPSARSRTVPDAPVAVSVEPDAREAMLAELARLKTDLAAAVAKPAKIEAPAASRAVRAFRRVAADDRVPVLNLGRPRTH